MIAAVEKAERLYRYAKAQGSPLGDWDLCLNQGEALELLGWYRKQYPDNQLLHDDIALAYAANDPWLVLKHFELLGLKMRPIESLN